MMDRESKQMFKLMADVLAAAGQPVRLAVLDFLKDGEKCVCDIADYVEAERSNVSRHLSVMLNAGLVTQRKDGLKMMYALRTPCILNITKCCAGVLKERARESQAVLGAL